MTTSPARDDKTWYNRFYEGRSEREFALPPEIVARYRKVPHPELFHLEKWHQLIGDVQGKKVLYVACGVEPSGILLALRGADVWVCDVAVDAIRQQRSMALANGTRHRTRLVVGAFERLPFSSQSFDRVIGLGILHHLQGDLETPCSEVARVLKADGFAVFQEPIARSRLLARIRTCLPVAPPRDASPQCRPLAGDALNRFTPWFQMEAFYFKCLGRLDRLLLGETPLEFTTPWRRWTTYALCYIDRLLFRLPGCDRLASAVVLRLVGR